MAPHDARRLAELTGCMPQEAASVLDVTPEWSIALANIQTVMSARRRLYQQKLLDVWTEFADSATNPYMNVSQTMNYLEHLGVDLESPLVLCIAYELQAPAIGRINRQLFVDGWARLEAGSLEDMKKCLPKLNENFQKSNTGYFRDVYRFTFDLNLEDGQRSLPRDLATVYWEILLKPRYPELIVKWLAFISTGPGEKLTVSRDSWNMLLEFCEYQKEKDPQLSNYDESNAWPIIIDDFVEFLSS